MDDGRSHESAVLRSLAPRDDDVHAVGCRIAARQNERLEHPPAGPSRRYYCGFRGAKVQDITLSDAGWELSLTLAPEDGESAHVDVALKVLVEGKNAKGTMRTDAGMALAEAFGPPVSHVCGGDLDDDQHPLRLYPDCLTSGLKDRWPDLIITPPPAIQEIGPALGAAARPTASSGTQSS